RVILRSRADVWSRPSYTLRGRTSPGCKIEVLGAARPASTTANMDGQFSLEVKLQENAVNDLTVVAAKPDGGETAKVMQRVRHDPGAGQVVEPAAQPIIET